MENINGQIRIIIEAVSPQVDDGQFYAKMVVGQQVEVACDLFADGHDVINGTLLYRHSSDKKWSNKYLKSYGNDRWGAQFIVEKQGFYHYTIYAQTSTTNLDPLLADEVVEIGKLKLIDDENSQYVQHTIIQTYEVHEPQ